MTANPADASGENPLTDLERRQWVKAEQQRWHEWRQAALNQLPALLVRINALEGKSYPGCGFHYALVQAFYNTGHFIASKLGIGGKDVYEIPVVAEVLLEGLISEIEKAEQLLAAETKERQQ